MESNKIAVAVITLVLGVVVGGIGGYVAGNNMHKDSMSSTTSMSNDKMATSSDTDGVTVGGAKMVRTKDLVDNAAAASNVSTTVSLVKLAGLVDTLKGTGPFTVFGPDNDAFGKLDKATVESLQKPENKATLAKILTYHVVPGTYTSADLKAMAEKGETLTTVEGEKLTPVIDGSNVQIQDAKGGKATVKTADVISSNGVTHVIDSVLMP